MPIKPIDRSCEGKAGYLFEIAGNFRIRRNMARRGNHGEKVDEQTTLL